MRRSAIPDGSAPERRERPEDSLHQGVGALLLLAGSAVVFSGHRMDESLFGGSLAVLLLLVGAGLMIVRRPPVPDTAPSSR
jgi:hypothetical protein